MGQPENMPNSDAYLVVYQDGTEETVWGYSIRYVADVSEEPGSSGRGEPVKIERLTPTGG
jgi:hypothetical protein